MALAGDSWGDEVKAGVKLALGRAPETFAALLDARISSLEELQGMRVSEISAWLADLIRSRAESASIDSSIGPAAAEEGSPRAKARL